jgi:hypothetical protein
MLALATAAFAGAAVAGNGNENAPGQVKQEQAAQPAQVQPQQSAPGQVKKESTPAPAKKSAGPSSSTHGVNSTQAGKKPSNSTTKWTHCTTGGGTGASATCTGIAPTPSDQPDVSKRYGNGKTAAQIANSRGAPEGTKLTGPGNSQPHKVAVCPQQDNKSGGVDVHAVKSYTTANCQAAVSTQPQSVTESRVCGSITTVTHTQEVVGVRHGKSKHVMTNAKSAHFTKHHDQQVTEEKTVVQVTPTGEVCGTAATQSSQPQTQASVVQVQALPATQGLPAMAQGIPTVQSLPATQGMPVAAQAQGGVLGAQASLAPKSKSKGGVLGTVGNIAGASLPFTGFPIWVAVLIAVALIAAGLMLRRRGRPYSAQL